MAGSWISSIGRRIGVRRSFDDQVGLAEFLAKPGGPAALEPSLGENAGGAGPSTERRRAPPVSASMRTSYAERKREALAIADHAAAELADGSTDRAQAAIAKVAGIAHQLAGSAGYFDETELGDLAAVVDVRLRAASIDDRRAVTEAIAELRAALLESDISAQTKQSHPPRAQIKKG